MAIRGGWCGRLERAAKTMFFIVVMVASLLVQCLPVLVAIGDVLVPCILISYFTCLRCHEFKQHLRRYSFKRSLVDIPLVSAIRSLIITCFYIICDGRAMSNGPYLGSVSFCSIFSIILLSIKTCIFSMNSHIEDEAWHTPLRRRLHIKNSWGMPVLFLSSIVFALGHMVIAYWMSYKAGRKLLFHSVDPVVVFSSKSIVSALQKVPRSPTPAVKASICDCEVKKKLFGSTHNQGALPVQLLADTDSSFVTCKGYVLHYKLSMPSLLPHSSSTTVSFESNSRCSSKHEKPLNVKNQHNLHSSNQFHRSSLYDPLLDSPSSSKFLPDETHGFNLHYVGTKENISESNPLDLDLEANDQCGIVLVHGFGGGVFSWRHVMGRLAQQVGCMVAAFDRPGWGFSPRPQRNDWEEKELPNPYKLDTQVDLLLSFCVEMGFSSVILVGHDDGGVLVLKTAERVQRSRPSVNAPLCIEGWVEALHEISKLPCETVLSAQAASALLQSMEELPVLVVAGAEDKLVSLQSAQAMASKLRLVAVSGCGHLPHEECPKALLAAIYPFISRLLGIERLV
ncbi:hypothetical protein V2J09_005435 [Rumex salicifolius]